VQVAVEQSDVERLGGEHLTMRAGTQSDGKRRPGDCDGTLRYENPGKSGRGMGNNLKR